MSTSTGSKSNEEQHRGDSGFGAAMWLQWRRSRLFYLIWVWCLSSVLPATVSKYHTLVPAGSDPHTLMTTMSDNPTLLAMLGPAFHLTSPGGFAMWRVGTFTAAAAAMMAALGVIRGTRAEEEEGRTELIRAGAVSRSAPLTTALILAVGASCVTGLLIAASMIGSRTPVAGSFATGMGIALTGCMFAGVAAVAAQIFDNARTARAWAVGIALGGLYLLRALIDASGPHAAITSARWLMPLDWAALARPYADERWWVLLLPVTVTVALIALSYRLQAQRDLGTGLRASTPGPAHAGPFLRGPGALAVQLQRGSLIGWGVGIVVSAVAIGAMSLSINTMLNGNSNVADLFRKMGGGSANLTTSFFQAMLAIMVGMCALCGVLLLARLRQEEQAGHAELILATATSRVRYATGFLLVATVTSSGLLLLTGVLLPVVQAVHDGSMTLLDTYLQAALVLWPGLIFVLGLAMALIGLAPRCFWFAWVVLGWSLLVSWLLPVFNPPAWVTKLHPWGYLPHLPTDHVNSTPIIAETLLGLALLAAGLIGYRRRDIEGR